MRRLLILALAVAFALVPGTAHATNPALPIPSPLTASWTAPAGTYSPAPTDTVTSACNPCTVDLSAATITGSGTGYILKPASGANVTLIGGTVSGMAGLVLGLVGTGGRATVTITGTDTTNVVSGFLYKTNDGGRVDVTMTGVVGSGFGAGVHTYGSVTASGNTLTGGGNPSTGDPVGFKADDLNTTGTPVPDQTFTVTGNTVTDFTSTGFQGDGAGAEETVWRAVVIGNTFGNESDASVDTKAQTTLVEGNTFLPNAAGSIRELAAHFGITYSVGNTYTVQAGAGIEATAGAGPDPANPIYPGAVSNGDTFTIGSGSLIAKAEVACTGSTGFTGPRTGFVELDHPSWTSGGTPWATAPQQCGGVPPTYAPVVNFRP